MLITKYDHDITLAIFYKFDRTLMIEAQISSRLENAIMLPSVIFIDIDILFL